MNAHDQLGVILDVLGPPSEEDMCFITDDQAVAYINEFKKQPPS